LVKDEGGIMKYRELNDLWKTFEERNRQWVHSLVTQAFSLQKTVFDRLEPHSEFWEDSQSKEKFRYVDLLDISGKSKPFNPGVAHESITEAGELFFGVSVTFEQGEKVWPKRKLNVPVAVRFKEGKAEFVFFDEQEKTVESNSRWISDIEQFAQDLIDKTENYLNYDPYQGPQKRSAIGFAPDIKKQP